MIIYKITNLIDDKVYIGQTTKAISKRWKQHIGSKRPYPISMAIKKYGSETFKVEIIEECHSRQELDEKEAFYIKLHNCISPNGYNLRLGGNTATHSKETREKISMKNKGKKVIISKETKIKMSEAQKGNKNHRFGKPGHQKHPFKVAIFCVELGLYFSSLNEAARHLNIDVSNLAKVVSGKPKYKSIKGYTFKLAEVQY